MNIEEIEVRLGQCRVLGFDDDSSYQVARQLLRDTCDLVNRVKDLESENAKLKEALTPLKQLRDLYDSPEYRDTLIVWDLLTIGMLRKASEALDG